MSRFVSYPTAFNASNATVSTAPPAVTISLRLKREPPSRQTETADEVAKRIGRLLLVAGLTTLLVVVTWVAWALAVAGAH